LPARGAVSRGARAGDRGDRRGARGAGRRRGPAAAALIVVLFLAHDVFSRLLVVARFYG
jgi:hypothetical protein